MRKNKLYSYTLLALGNIIFLIGYLGVYLNVEYTTNRLTENQLESSQREAKEIARLVETQLQLGATEQETIKNLQNSIENTNTSMGFICMFNSSGVEICHPDPSKIGNQITQDNSSVNDLVNEGSKNFLDLLNKQVEFGGVRDFNESSSRSSEIIYLHPVNGVNWIVAAHSNLDVVRSEGTRIRNNFLVIFFICSSLMVGVSFVFIRYIGANYEKVIEDENENLQIELVKLNQQVFDFQNQTRLLAQKAETSSKKNLISGSKSRVVCYQKDELILIDVSEIAYLYLEDSVVYLYCLLGKKHYYQQTLDKFMKETNPKLFFRVNRQTIISINAINKILKYGTNQLKVELKSKNQFSTVISKNKIALFRQWIDS